MGHVFHKLSHLLGIVVLVLHANHLIHAWAEWSVAMQWTGIGFLLVFLEFNLRYSIAIWFGAAAFIIGLLAMLASLVNLEIHGEIQTFLFLGLSAVGFYYRPYLLRLYMGKDDWHPTPAQRMLGSSGTCDREIIGFSVPGMVRVDGHDWQALEVHGRTVKPNTKVTIVGRHDMTLLVEAASDGAPAVSSKIGRLIGVRAAWVADGSVMLANKTWKAMTWPPGAHLRPGTKVRIVGIRGNQLLVEQDQTYTQSFKNLEGAVGTCRVEIDDMTHMGSVDISGVRWSARSNRISESIKTGDMVKVVGVDGAVLIVQPHITSEPLGVDESILNQNGPEA